MAKREKESWLSAPHRAVQIYLPSFDITILRSDPRAVSVPTGEGGAELAVDSGDAFSASYLPGTEHALDSKSLADHAFQNLDLGYLRRILLIILSEEEWQEVVWYHDDRLQFVPKEGLPEGEKPTLRDLERVIKDDPYAQVRISDLRLAKDLSPPDLRRELNIAITSIPIPYSADEVRHWKWRVLREYETPLKKPDEWTEQERRREVARAKAVSFSAAALLLLHDLNQRKASDSSHKDLVSTICKLRRIVSDLQGRLGDTALELHRVLYGADKLGRPRDPALKNYRALHLYRMGYSWKDLASEVGITPARRVEGKVEGSKAWGDKLREVLKKGVEVEAEVFPTATYIFQNSSDEDIRVLAIQEYERYEHFWHYEPITLPDYVEIEYYDDLLLDILAGRSVDQDQEIRRALIQLGSCLNNETPVFPEL
jgi:hypothetical protein